MLPTLHCFTKAGLSSATSSAAVEAGPVLDDPRYPSVTGRVLYTQTSLQPSAWRATKVPMRSRILLGGLTC